MSQLRFGLRVRAPWPPYDWHVAETGRCRPRDAYDGV